MHYEEEESGNSLLPTGAPRLVTASSWKILLCFTTGTGLFSSWFQSKGSTESPAAASAHSRCPRTNSPNEYLNSLKQTWEQTTAMLLFSPQQFKQKNENSISWAWDRILRFLLKSLIIQLANYGQVTEANTYIVMKICVIFSSHLENTFDVGSSKASVSLCQNGYRPKLA